MEFLSAIVFLSASVVVPCETYKDQALASSFKWGSTHEFAIKTPHDVSGPFGDGPGHSSLHWQTPVGEMHERAGSMPISLWAQDVVAVCTGDIDEQPATIYKVKYDGVTELVAKMDHSPLGKNLVITVPLKDRKSIDVEINELLSATFINDPSRIRLISISSEDSDRFVLVENEIGEKRKLREGDYISDRTGYVDFIGDDYFVSKMRPPWYKNADPSVFTNFRFSISLPSRAH